MFDKYMLYFGRACVVGIWTVIRPDNGEFNRHSLEV